MQRVGALLFTSKPKIGKIVSLADLKIREKSAIVKMESLHQPPTLNENLCLFDDRQLDDL